MIFHVKKINVNEQKDYLFYLERKKKVLERNSFNNYELNINAFRYKKFKRGESL